MHEDDRHENQSDHTPDRVDYFYIFWYIDVDPVLDQACEKPECRSSEHDEEEVCDLTHGFFLPSSYRKKPDTVVQYSNKDKNILRDYKPDFRI